MTDRLLILRIASRSLVLQSEVYFRSLEELLISAAAGFSVTVSMRSGAFLYILSLLMKVRLSKIKQMDFQ